MAIIALLAAVAMLVTGRSAIRASIPITLVYSTMPAEVSSSKGLCGDVGVFAFDLRLTFVRDAQPATYVICPALLRDLGVEIVTASAGMDELDSWSRDTRCRVLETDDAITSHVIRGCIKGHADDPGSPRIVLWAFSANDTRIETSSAERLSWLQRLVVR